MLAFCRFRIQKDGFQDMGVLVFDKYASQHGIQKNDLS